MAEARYVWLPQRENQSPRQDWVLFHRMVEWTGAGRAQLHLFASTRYRLRVNGKIIGHGPVRYVPGFEQHDSYDLAAHLSVGENHIVVEACFINANNYQSMPGDQGRFIAWGEVTDGGDGLQDLATPGDWRAKRSGAWDLDVPAFSFAIGPVELLDQAKLGQELESTDGAAPIVVAEADPPLAPRSLPMPTDATITPRPLHAGPMIDDEQRIGFLSAHPTVRSEWQRSNRRDEAFRYVTFLRSPKAQQVSLGVHWGPHFLNGQEIAGENDPARGNRQNVTVTLNEGWNLLCGEPAQLHPVYPLLIGLPRDAGLEARSRPDLSDSCAMRYLPPALYPEAERWSSSCPAGESDLDLDDPAWQLVDSEALPHCAARLMSWDQPDTRKRDESPSYPTTVGEDATWSIVVGFGTEFLGYVQVDIDAPAGTVVDTGYDERLRGDGCLSLFSCNPFVESCDRFVCKGGRETLETFLPRGGNYAQVTIRRPAGVTGSVTLHGVTLRDARCLPSLDGEFACDRGILNWTWDHGVESIRASIEDTFCDSPWRERGTYLGDSYVQSMVHLCISKDLRIIQRALRLFAQGQREDGQLQGVVPAWLQRPHGDFTMIYGIWLYEFWAATGDMDTVSDCLPAVDRVLASPTWVASEHSMLWNPTDDNRLFIDWGADKDIRLYEESGVLNALRYRLLQCAAELHTAQGDEATAKRYLGEADELAGQYRERLWLAEHGRFAAGTADGKPIDREILHGNILALAYGLADADQEPALREFVVRRMQGNAARAAKAEPNSDIAELYYLKFALQALTRIERYDVAEQVIADHMQIMADRDAPTFWECLHRGVVDQGSICHSWSTAPLEYFHRHLLGVRQVEPGNPTRLVVDPHPSSVSAANGKFPTPFGPVTVKWHRDDDGKLHIEAEAPDEIELIVS